MSREAINIIIFIIIIIIVGAVIFNIFRFSVAGLSVGDSIRLLQLGTAVGRGAMAVGVEYHGGLVGIGIGSAMVVGVSNLEAT